MNCLVEDCSNNAISRFGLCSDHVSPGERETFTSSLGRGALDSVTARHPSNHCWYGWRVDEHGLTRSMRSTDSCWQLIEIPKLYCSIHAALIHLDSDPSTPARIISIEHFWGDDEPSPIPRLRADWWLTRITRGFRRIGRLRSMGYYESAEYFGVYIWEWFNVLRPAFEEVEKREEGS